MSYSSANTITTVARREIHVALRSKAIMISIGLVLVVMLGAIGAFSYFGNSKEEAKKLAVVGTSAAPFEQVETTTIDNVSDAEAEVREGNMDAALVKTDSGYDFLYKDSPDAELSATVGEVVSASAQQEALDKVGVSAEEFAAAMPASDLHMKSVEDDSEANMESILTILIAVSLMSYFIMLFAGNIGGRVTEEKSSRVVEIILASARPVDFLAGKILANAAIGFVASAIILGVGAVALSFSNILEGVSFDYTTIPVMLVAFLIGLLLFGSLYAAAGSLVSRTEDLQSTQMPILLLVFAMIYAPFFGMTQLDSTVMQTLAWIPPFSLSVGPMQLAAGNMSLLEVCGSFAIALVVTLGILILVARIYRNAILHNGRKLSWAKAIKG